jgi:hypothetical protein
MNFKPGDRVDAIDDSGNVKYTGLYLGSGHPAAGVGVSDRTKLHYAIQIGDRGDTVYLEAFYWSLRQAR